MVVLVRHVFSSENVFDIVEHEICPSEPPITIFCFLWVDADGNTSTPYCPILCSITPMSTGSGCVEMHKTMSNPRLCMQDYYTQLTYLNGYFHQFYIDLAEWPYQFVVCSRRMGCPQCNEDMCSFVDELPLNSERVY